MAWNRNIKFKKKIGTTIATEKGHLDQERKNLRTTKIEINEDFFPSKNTSIANEVYTTMYNVKDLKELNNKAYVDLMEKFPHKSSRGAQYIFIMYDYDSNAILSSTLKTRQAKEITTAFNQCYAKLLKHNNQPKLFIIDNECSNDLKLSIKKNNNTYELVPPHMHRRNAAEKAIRTFKNHFLSGLASCDPNYPIFEWDRLLNQCEITLNLLRSSRVNPKLSAHAYLHGIHDFNKVPMAPPGTKILIHANPSKRPSFAYHGSEGWYIGPSQQHYRYVRCYLPKTRVEVDADTVKFIPSRFTIPEAILDLHVRRSLDDLVHLLHGNQSCPSLVSNTSKNAII